MRHLLPLGSVSYEAANERERRVGYFAPAAVDDKRVPPVLHLHNLGHPTVLLLLLERGVRDRPGNRVVFLTGDDQHRATIRVLDVDLGLRPRIEVGGRGLEERYARRRHGESLVELLCLLLVDGVREAEAELLEGERDRPLAVRRGPKNRPRRFERRE